MSRISCFGIIFNLILGAFASDAFAERIGTAQVVMNSVTGDANNTERRIGKGDGIFQNELIKTGFLSKADLQFLDKTLLSIGAKSEVRLDTFVYNPRTRSGKIVINTIKGAFRFVSGAARKSAYRIKTPVATIGVRGTVIDGYTDSAGRIGVYILQKGGMKVCSGTMCRDVNRKKDFVTVSADGQVSKPKPWLGRLRGVTFETIFPLGRGRLSIDPSHFNFKNNGGGSYPRGGGSQGSPSSPPSPPSTSYF